MASGVHTSSQSVLPTTHGAPRWQQVHALRHLTDMRLDEVFEQLFIRHPGTRALLEGTTCGRQTDTYVVTKCNAPNSARAVWVRWQRRVVTDMIGQLRKRTFQVAWFVGAVL